MRRSLFDFKLVKHCQSAHLQWSASGFVSPIVFLFLVFAIAIPAIPILSHPFLSFRSVVVVTKEPSVASMRCSSACVLGMIRTMSWPLEPKQDAMFHAIETAPGVLRGASFFLGQRLALHCQILSEMHMFFLAQCSDIKWFVSPNSVVGANLTPTPPMALSTDMLTQWSPASTTSRELSSLTAACDGEGRGDISSL